MTLAFDDGSWRTALPGKEILGAFRAQYLPTLPNELFIDHLVHFAAEAEPHSEIQRLCEFIESA